MADLQKALQTLGLKPKQAELYLLLLSLGTVPASVIGKRLGVPKGTARYMCLELVESGFATAHDKNNVVYYTAEAPENILKLLDRQRFEIDKKEETVRSVLNQLKETMQPKTDMPTMKSFEGVEGAARAWDELLSEVPEGGEILGYFRSFGPADDTFNLSPAHERFIKNRVKKKIWYRAIAMDHERSHSAKKLDKTHFRETRILPGKNTDQPTQILIYDDKIHTITNTPHGVFTTIVKNASSAAVMKKAFEALWERLDG